MAGVLRRGDADEHVVVCPLRAVPAGFPELVVTSPQRLPRPVLRQPMAWASLAALAATPLYDHAALTVARLATFTRPVVKGAGTDDRQTTEVQTNFYRQISTYTYTG